MELKNGPFWIERAVRNGVMVDNLGLRQPGMTIANALLPGITNGTNRARQYSLVAWLFAHGTSVDHMRRMETAVVHAIRTHNHDGGLSTTGSVGSSAVPLENNVDNFRLVHDKDLPSVRYAAYYGPSARYLARIIHES